MHTLHLELGERARAFREDVAEQLRSAANTARLAATVALHHDQAVLEFDDAFGEGASLRVIADFHDGAHGEPGIHGVTLSVQMSDQSSALLALVWRDDPAQDEATALRQRLTELEARTDERSPLERRGLNAHADTRTGRYRKGEIVKQLVGDLRGWRCRTSCNSTAIDDAADAGRDGGESLLRCHHGNPLLGRATEPAHTTVANREDGPYAGNRLAYHDCQSLIDPPQPLLL